MTRWGSRSLGTTVIGGKRPREGEPCWYCQTVRARRAREVNEDPGFGWECANLWSTSVKPHPCGQRVGSFRVPAIRAVAPQSAQRRTKCEDRTLHGGNWLWVSAVFMVIRPAIVARGDRCDRLL